MHRACRIPILLCSSLTYSNFLSIPHNQLTPFFKQDSTMHASFGSKQTKLPSLFDAPLLAKIEDKYVGPEEGGRIVFFKSTTEY